MQGDTVGADGGADQPIGHTRAHLRECPPNELIALEQSPLVARDELVDDDTALAIRLFRKVVL